MAKTATLYNDGSAIGPTFTTHAGTPSASGGNIVLAAGDTIKSVATDWDLTASSLRLTIVSPGSVEGLFLVFDQGAGIKPCLNLHWTGWRAGFFNGAADNAGNFGSYGGVGTAVYGHISESGGQVYFGTSSDGVTVTDFYNTSFTSPAACRIYLLSTTVSVSIDEIGTYTAPAIPAFPALGRYGTRGPVR